MFRRTPPPSRPAPILGSQGSQASSSIITSTVGTLIQTDRQAHRHTFEGVKTRELLAFDACLSARADSVGLGLDCKKVLTKEKKKSLPQSVPTRCNREARTQPHRLWSLGMAWLYIQVLKVAGTKNDWESCSPPFCSHPTTLSHPPTPQLE